MFTSPAGKIISLLLLLFMSSCAPHHAKEEAHSTSFTHFPDAYPYTVVSTTAMISDLVRNIAGPYVNVQQIIPNGIDPHTYIPSRSDIVKIDSADLIVYNGLHLEGSLNNALARLSRKKNIISIAATLDKENFFLDSENLTDPHIWMDVSMWMQAAIALTELFSQFDEPHRDYYYLKLEHYSALLNDLHEYVYTLLQSVPEHSRILITSHDAFQYFASAYDFLVYGIQGISTVSEASLNYINFLVSHIIERRVPMVFVETSVSPKYIRVLIEGVQSHGVSLGNGGALYADAMGEEGSYEGSYIGMMDYNARTITRSLHGNVPYKNFFDYRSQKYEEAKSREN